MVGFFCTFSVFEGELAETIPVVHTNIAGCRIVGRLTAGWLVHEYVCVSAFAFIMSSLCHSFGRQSSRNLGAEYDH